MKTHFTRQGLFLLLLAIGSLLSCNRETNTQVTTASEASPAVTSFWQTKINTFEKEDPYFFETTAITSPYGPRSITRNIIQDRKGNLWFASWEGIIRYDGKTFTNFTNKENLRRFHVFSVLEDKAGNLWFGTIGAGVYRYDGESFTNFTTKDGLGNDKIGCMLEDKTGKIWFGTMGGLSCFDGQSFHNYTTEDGLIDNDVNSIIQDKTGKLWFGTKGGVSYCEGTSMSAGKIAFTHFANQAGLPFNNVRSIIQDQKGKLWIGGNDGLWRYDGKSYLNFSPNFIGFLYEDKKGNIWISSGEANSGNMALSRYDGKSTPLPFGRADFTEIIKGKGQIFGITEDADGNIWFGTVRGVCRFDGKTFTYFKDPAIPETDC